MSVDTASDPPPPVRLVPPVPQSGRRRLLLGAALLVTFVCGGVVGATSAVYYQNSRGMRMRMPDDPPRHLLADLQWKLDLDEKQSEEIGKILREHFQELKEIREKQSPVIDASFEKMRKDVAGHLDDRQQVLWNERFDRMRRHAFPPPPGGHHRAGGGPHFGGPPGDHDRRSGFDDRRGPRDGFGPPGFGEGIPRDDGSPDGPRFEKGKRMKKGPPEGGPRPMKKPPRDGDRSPPSESGDPPRE